MPVIPIGGCIEQLCDLYADAAFVCANYHVGTFRAVILYRGINVCCREKGIK
jgi:hypothetical protein